MKSFFLFASLALLTLVASCDRRDDPRNAPTPQPTGETAAPPTDPEAPTAPIEGDAPDKGTPADPASGN